MSPKLPHIKFNAGTFGHTLVGRRAGRWLQKTFDGIGKEAVIYIVQNDKVLIDLLPLETRMYWKNAAKQYSEMFPRFTDEEVYNWVPDYWREIIESVEDGREWGLRQVAAIRTIISS